MASSSSSFFSRTYRPSTLGNVPYARGCGCPTPGEESLPSEATGQGILLIFSTSFSSIAWYIQLAPPLSCPLITYSTPFSIVGSFPSWIIQS